MANEREMTVIQAARKLGVGLDYVYSLLWTGKLKARKRERKWVIPESAVKERVQALKARGNNQSSTGSNRVRDTRVKLSRHTPARRPAAIALGPAAANTTPQNRPPGAETP